MEARLNRIIAWLDDPSGDVTEDIRILDAYYRSPLWRSDFEADEAGKLPAACCPKTASTMLCRLMTIGRARFPNAKNRARKRRNL